MAEWSLLQGPHQVLNSRFINESVMFVWQIKHLNEPFEVKVTEWNTGGLLTRIEVCLTSDSFLFLLVFTSVYEYII